MFANVLLSSEFELAVLGRRHSLSAGACHGQVTSRAVPRIAGFPPICGRFRPVPPGHQRVVSGYDVTTITARPLLRR